MAVVRKISDQSNDFTVLAITGVTVTMVVFGSQSG